MKKSLFNKSAVALAAGLFAACAANAYVVGTAGAVNTVPEATVLNINPNGLGHQLFVPYYTAQDGNRTYLTLVNTDMRNGKAVKVRFRGASNSDDVLDFTVFLSPGDAWTAVVSAATNSNPARLEVVEGDNSCTAPAIPAGGQEFRTFRLHPQLTPDLIARETREGYIEIFNEADIPPTVAAIPVGSSAPTLYRAIEHSATTGVPLSCDAIRNTSTTSLASVTPVANGTSTYLAGATHSIQDMAQINETYAQAQARGFEVPTTGLMASWAIANPANGRSWSGNAVAVQAETAAGLPGHGNIVYHPQRGDHTAAELPIATIRNRTADPLLRGGGTSNNVAIGAVPADPNPPVNVIPDFQDPAVANMVPIRALSVDLPDMSTPYLWTGIGANGSGPRIQAQRLSEALANSAVSNEILTLGSGRTDWSFTFPTRRYNVARAYATGANESAGTTRYTDYRFDDTGAAIAAPAGRNYFNPVNVVSENTAGRRHQLCVNGISNQNGAKGGPEGLNAATSSGNRVSGVTANREESFLAGGSGGIDFSPAPPPGTTAAFCGEAGVFSFNRTGEPTGVLNAAVAIRNFNTSGRNFGWSRFLTLGLENVAGAQGAASITGANPGLGLPVVGFAFWTFENLSIALPHRRTVPQ